MGTLPFDCNLRQLQVGHKTAARWRECVGLLVRSVYRYLPVQRRGLSVPVPVPESAVESCARLYGNALTGRGPGASAAARPKRLARGAIGERRGTVRGFCWL